MKRNGAILFLLIFCSLLSHAALPVNTELVKKTVVFIYPAKPDGEPDKEHPMGTGFLVAVPKKAASTFYLFLVTARHVVDPNWIFCGPDPQRVFVRFNKANYDSKKDGTGVEYLPLDLSLDGRALYFVSDDEQVDAAVVLLNVSQLPQSKYDYLPAHIAEFATSEELKGFTIGDAILSAGLLPGAPGVKRNYPIFKFGYISNIPDEPIWTGCEGMPALRQERVWFIAANQAPGSSGAPVLYVPNGAPGVIFGGGNTRAVLIGLQSMSFGRADVAGMTPVEDIVHILENRIPLPLDLTRGRAPDSQAGSQSAK